MRRIHIVLAQDARRDPGTIARIAGTVPIVDIDMPRLERHGIISGMAPITTDIDAVRCLPGVDAADWDDTKRV